MLRAFSVNTLSIQEVNFQVSTPLFLPALFSIFTVTKPYHMLGLFGKSSPRKCPIPEGSQKWIETAFPFLIRLFGEEKIKHKKVLVPHYSDFPVSYDGGTQSAWDTLHIIATRMEVDPDDITLDIYTDVTRTLTTGSAMGGKFYLGDYDNTDTADTDLVYQGRHKDGKLHIGLEEGKLSTPEWLVAYIAHEIAHMRVMESLQPEDNHQLADLTAMLFGLGVFNANTSFHMVKKGYVLQREWGYALALFARLRGEKDPAWAKYLTPNIRSDFAKCQKYLDDH